MPAKGDDHVRREHVAKARQFLPGIAGLSARERSRRLADHLGLSVRRATTIRVEAERQLADAADAVAPAADCLRRLLERLGEFDREAERVLRNCPRDQPASAIGALKFRLAIELERAKWRGLVPRSEDVSGAGTGEVNLHVHLGPADGD